MKKPKYSTKFIKVETLTIDNVTGEVCNPSSQEKLLDAIYGNKFSIIQVYSHVASSRGNTKREVIFSHADFLEFADAGFNISYELFIN